MEKLWILYWIFIFVSIVFGIIVTIKTKKISGIFQSILSVVASICGLFYSLKRDWVNAKEGEVEYFLKNISNGSIEAIILFFLYICIIIIFLYNILKLKKLKK